MTEHLDPLVAPIRKERRKLKITQADLARMAGISRRTLVLIEGGGDCTLSTLRRLYTALALDVEARPFRRPTLEDLQKQNEEEFRERAQRRNRSAK